MAETVEALFSLHPSPFPKIPEIFQKKVLTFKIKGVIVIIKFHICFLKGCDEDGQELKFTESQWLVEIDNGDSYKAHPFRAGSPNNIR